MLKRIRMLDLLSDYVGSEPLTCILSPLFHHSSDPPQHSKSRQHSSHPSPHPAFLSPQGAFDHQFEPMPRPSPSSPAVSGYTLMLTESFEQTVPERSLRGGLF